MIKSVIRSAVLATVAAGSLVAQEAAKKPPYEFIADFALAASQGNQEVSTVSLGEKYTYAFSNWKFAQNFSALRGSANGTKNAELYQGGLRGDIVLQKKLSAYLNLNALRNTPAGLTSQIAEGVGLSYQFVDTDIDKLKLSFGAGALQRSFVGGAASKSDVVGNLDGLFRHMFSKVSYFEQAAAFTPNFTTSNAWLFSSLTSVVAPLSSKIGIKVGYQVNYNNEPPFRLAPNATTRFKKFDGLFTTGIQFTY